jgi:putative addiction module component (TIGR02574 family)
MWNNTYMSISQQLVEQSLALSPDERAELAEMLLESLDDDTGQSEGSDVEWANELDRRVDRIEAGEAVWHERKAMISELRHEIGRRPGP